LASKLDKSETSAGGECTSKNLRIEDMSSVAVGFKTYMCLICGFIYEEQKGLPDEGIAPGTRWEDVPPNWVCPECGARKEDFEMIEI
jgi:rubredoxin